MALNNRFTIQILHPMLYRRRNTVNIGCKVLTSTQMKINIYNKQFERSINCVKKIKFHTYQFLYSYIYEKSDVDLIDTRSETFA